MFTNTKKDAPPSYEAVENTSSARLLDGIQGTVAAERNASDANPVEVARMRRFIRYCLCVDYRHTVANSLSTEDTQHFSNLCQTINGLYDSHDRHLLSASQRNELGAYLRRFVHEPCRALGIPAECAVLTVLRFVKFMDAFAGYKGCAYGVLHILGPTSLAQKLWLDTTVLIPRLFPSEAQTAMLKRVNQLANVYFLNICGIEASIVPGDEAFGYSHTQTVAYDLTERGKTYEKTRSKAI